MKYLEKMTKKRLGEVLVEEGLLSNEQVNESLKLQKKSGQKLGEILIQLGYVSDYDIARTLAVQFQLPFISLKTYRLEKEVISILPKEMLHDHQIVPIDRIEDILLLVISGFISRKVIGQIEKAAGAELAFYIGLASEVKEVLNEFCPLPLEEVRRRQREIKLEAQAAREPEEQGEEEEIVEMTPKPAAPPEQETQAPLPQSAAPEPQQQQPPAKPKPQPRQQPQQPQTIETGVDGTRTYEISALDVDDTSEWEKVLSEADSIVGEDGEAGDWLKIFDDAEDAVRKEIEEKQQDDDE